MDLGNFKGKTAGKYGVDSFKTNICGWFERDLDDKFGDDDMDFEIDGKKGYAGSIAEHEDEFGDGTIYGDTKAHDHTKIRALLAIHRYMEKYNLDIDTFRIVTGQPLINHKEEEKNKIINMLRGEHKFVVNGKKRKIHITDVKVTPEGTGAFWSAPVGGSVSVLDIGSGTVNMVRMLNKLHIHKSSGTMNTGMETLKNKNDLESMARGIIQATTKLKWKKDDSVLVCGGAAEALTPILQRHYMNAVLINPQLRREHDILSAKPVYANAVGFYTLAKAVYS
jgi:plasmid segregation protein ParM